MATKKQKTPKRNGPSKASRPAVKKGKAAPVKKKPTAKPAKKAVKKTVAKRPAAKVPDKRVPAKAVKVALPKKTPEKKPAAKAAVAQPAVKKAVSAPTPEPVKAAKPPAVKAPAKEAAPAKASPAKPAPQPPSELSAAPLAAEKRERPPRGERGARPDRGERGERPPGRPGRKPRPPEGGEGDGSLAESTISSLPPIRPYRGTQGGKPPKAKPLRKKSRPRDRFSKLFAEFETKPATPAKKKRRVLDEDEEETNISVLREKPRIQIESPEQIRAGVIKKYLAGGMPSCPVGCGGIAEVVRVGTMEDGSGEVWIECLSCAQRERFHINKATSAERQAAVKSMEENGEALCPRHGRPVQLRRRGRDLVCPECGILYPE